MSSMPQQVAAPQLDRIDGHLARRDVEHDLPGERLVLPRPPVAGTSGGVACRPTAAGTLPPAPGRARGRGCRRTSPASPATASGTRRRRTRSRGGRPGSGPRRRSPSWMSACSWRDQPADVRFSWRSSIHFTASRELRGGEHDRHLLALDEDLLAEAAARVPGDGPDPVLRDAEQASAERSMLVRRLRRHPHGHLVGAGIVLDDDAPGLERHRGVGLLVDRAFDDVRRRPRTTGLELARPARRRRGSRC